MSQKWKESEFLRRRSWKEERRGSEERQGVSRPGRMLTAENMGFLSIKSMKGLQPWIIAFACFWINLFMFAVFRSGGVLYLALTRTLNCTYSQASWPITLAGAIASITCLPAGFLSHYFTVRTIVTTGTFIVFFSISSCFYVTSIRVMITVLGVFQGKLLSKF